MEPNSAEASKNDKISNKKSYLESKKEIPYIPTTSFDLLNKYRSQLKRFRSPKSPQTARGTSSHQVLSAESISGIALSHKEHDCDKDIELGLNLTLAAEKISDHDYDHAEILLSSCRHASAPATPIQKVVHYFAEALREKIDIDKGQIDLERKAMHVEELLSNVQPDKVACEVGLPFGQITGFVATQTILEHVGLAPRIHIIDFRIRSGPHWPIVMDAIAKREHCPLELLKITAVDTSKDTLEDTGRWLSTFAESMNLPFSFKIVLSELKDLKTDFFELEAGEVVVLYLDVRLWSVLAQPNHLKALMREFQNLNPCLMVVAEVEANTNTPIFLDRFHEALYYCSALFDCFETCLQKDSQFRMSTEEVYFQNAIRDIITSEDEDRIYHHARIGFWREMLSEFGLVELELSHSSLFQASSVVKSFSHWSSCTTNMNGKSMIIEWKGTPIKSISAWKFPRD